MNRKRPNVLLIMADDHATGAISCYGSYRNHTPHLDRIAADGVRLENCFCTNAICTPSRATVLTGLYAHTHGAITFNAPDSSRPTFPELLRSAGYYTAVAGKWHLNSEPTGFDDWAVLPGQGRYADPEIVVNGTPRAFPGYVTDVITQRTISLLESRPTNRPFCILSCHKAPHDPWQSDTAHDQLFDNEQIPEPSNLFDRFETRSSVVRKTTQTIGAVSPGHTRYELETSDITNEADRRSAQYQIFIKRYLRCVSSLDDNVGNLLNYLDDAGLSDNTIVIYTSDHGFFLGEHGFYDKRFMYEESLRIPFLIRYPEEIRPDTTESRIVLNTDIAGTLLDYCGVESPVPFQGSSIKPLLSGENPEGWRRSMYYRYYRSHFDTPSHWGVRTERHKYIYYHETNETELFDLQNDRAEMNNLSCDPTYAGVLSAMEEETARLRRELSDNETGPEADARSRELLNAPLHPLYG